MLTLPRSSNAGPVISSCNCGPLPLSMFTRSNLCGPGSASMPCWHRQAAAQQQPFNSWPAPPQPVQAAAQQQPFKIWHEPPPPPPLQPEPPGRPPFPDQAPVTWPPQSSSHHKTRSKKKERPRSTNNQEACSSARGAQGLTQPPQLPPQRSCNDMTQQQKTELATESSAASGSQGLTYSLPLVASYKLSLMSYATTPVTAVGWQH